MDKKKGVIVLQLDQPRTWRLTMNARAAIEGALSQRQPAISFEKFLRDIDNWDAKDWCMFLWAGMKHEDKQLTPEALGDMVVTADMLKFKIQLIESSLKMYEEAQNSASPEFKKKVDDELRAKNVPTAPTTPQPNECSPQRSFALESSPASSGL